MTEVEGIMLHKKVTPALILLTVQGKYALSQVVSRGPNGGATKAK